MQPITAHFTVRPPSYIWALSASQPLDSGTGAGVTLLSMDRSLWASITGLLASVNHNNVADGGGAGRCDSNAYRECAVVATPRKAVGPHRGNMTDGVGAGRCYCETCRARAIGAHPEKLWASITTPWRMEAVLGGVAARSDVNAPFPNHQKAGVNYDNVAVLGRRWEV